MSEAFSTHSIFMCSLSCMSFLVFFQNVPPFWSSVQGYGFSSKPITSLLFFKWSQCNTVIGSPSSGFSCVFSYNPTFWISSHNQYRDREFLLCEFACVWLGSFCFWTCSHIQCKNKGPRLCEFACVWSKSQFFWNASHILCSNRASLLCEFACVLFGSLPI